MFGITTNDDSAINFVYTKLRKIFCFLVRGRIQLVKITLDQSFKLDLSEEKAKPIYQKRLLQKVDLENII